jgi:protein associated with RNAse G/E
VYSPPGALTFDHRKGVWLPAPDGLFEIFFRSNWYAVVHVVGQYSQRNLIYTHIAMPATHVEDTLTWVDLDLDFRVHLDGSFERVNELEFEQNRQAMGYSAEVVLQARKACEEVERLYSESVFPFNHREQVRKFHERIEIEGITYSRSRNQGPARSGLP